MNFELPAELIAQEPVSPRDHARLLVYNRATEEITDSQFYELESFLNPKSTLVLNNSKVEKCRLLFPVTSNEFSSESSKNVEVFVVETINPTTIRAMVRPGKKFKLGTCIDLGGVEFCVDAVDENGIRIIRLSQPIDSPQLNKFRVTPLPPYIAQNESLADEYQTVYAKPLGSMASPTAGLHFTDELLTSIGNKHDIAELTLHVGLGTFAPLKEENITSGKLHSERYELQVAVANKINRASHITAVGTTSVRTLETLAGIYEKHSFKPSVGSTDIFLRPGHVFTAVDSMITNFHLPSTSLLLLVQAFIANGKNIEKADTELQRIYSHAIRNKYRFYSFGDAMLIL